MKLKGTMVMELTDTNTGDVETSTEENMVTNAITTFLGSIRWRPCTMPPGNMMNLYIIFYFIMMVIPGI